MANSFQLTSLAKLAWRTDLPFGQAGSKKSLYPTVNEGSDSAQFH